MSRVAGNVEARRVGSPSARLHRVNAALLSLLVVGITACGGSGGGGGGASTAPAVSPPPASNPPPSGRGTLHISVVDWLGKPVPGIKLWLNTDTPDEDKRVVADSEGRAAVDDVIAEPLTIVAYDDESYGAVRSAVVAGGVREAVVAVSPAVGPAGGVRWASVPAGGISDEGRTLEFSLWLLEVPDPRFVGWISRDGNAIVGDVGILPCSPDPSNDGPRFRPDCVVGGDGYDAPYDGGPVSVGYVPGRGYDAIFRPDFLSVLLLDQSDNAIIDDPADKRLFAARYFLTQTPVASDYPLVDEAALAVFATDDTTRNRAALIPQKPVTIFPVENPRYLADGREVLFEVESLAALEGGSAPLLDSIDRMLDFAGGRSGTASSLIVVTNGRDESCGDGAQCRARLEALAQKSRALNVAIVAVGLEGPSGPVDYATLSALALSGSGGAVFRAADPGQLAPILRTALQDRLNEADLGKVTFRIRSGEAGTFVSGRTVLGTVRVEVCPFECIRTDIPFAVRIP